MEELVTRGSHAKLQHDVKIVALHIDIIMYLPTYDVLCEVDAFLNIFERDVLE